MKKVLFLLLVTSISYGQALFDKGIKVTTNINDTIATKVVVKSANNVYNYQDIVKFQKEKGFLSTGLIKNGLISANGDPTKFNITAGIGIISNFDDPENPISNIVRFPAFNSITPTYLTTGNITYVAINSTPAVVMQATPFTPVQRRYLIILGAVIHSNLTTINVLNNISAPTNADTNQLHDFMEAVGALNITGNKYTANGANLQLNKSAGVLFKLGSNFAVDWKNPHEIAQIGGTAITFRYRTQNGTESADMTSISPALYDLNNVLTTVPNNKFTIQTVTVFQTGLTRIQWGQSLYDDLQSAKNALLTRDFVVESNIKENGVTRAYIIVRNSTASLQNVADAYISEAQKFGGVASGGVALTLANIVTALGYTPENVANKQNSLAVDGTGVKYPTVDATNAGLALKQNTLTNPITGTGTTNFIPKFTGTTTQGNSIISESSGNIGISNPTATSKLMVGDGTLNANQVIRNFSANSDIYIGQSSSLFATPSNTFGAIFQDKVVPFLIGTTGNSPLIFGTANNRRIQVHQSGRTSFGSSTDDGINIGQFTGTVTFSAGTTANQGVIKSQLDLKADLASPTFTGVPSVPTATAGTNTTQIASTAYVLANVNANAVLLTGDQTKTGRLSFNNTGAFVNGLQVTTNTAGSPNEYGALFNNTGTGGSAMYVQSTNGGWGQFVGVPKGKGIVVDVSGNIGDSVGLTLMRNGVSTGNLMEFSNGSMSANGDLSIPKLNMGGTIVLKSYTVATLPTGVQGASAYVTDALAPTYLVTIVGGGTVVTPVFYNGTNWVAH